MSTLIILYYDVMSIDRIDLNLLFYLDILLKESNVTRAANQVGISQPAMSNSLNRLRRLFNDPLLVRTSEGMVATERAQQLQPVIRQLLATVETAIQPQLAFDPASSQRVFRIMVSDYAESTLFPPMLRRLRAQAPGITLDIMTPSDVSFLDVEQGKVDIAINRFDSIPQSFHQMSLWHDHFSCLLSVDNPIRDDFSLGNYLKAQHVWVSKTGMGIGAGMHPDDIQRLGWVDEALARLEHKRRISIFTRHYQAAMLLAEEKDLVVTIPAKAARLQKYNPRLVLREPPFDIPPIDLQMAWSPLLHNNAAHQWMRRLIVTVAHGLEQ